RASFLWSWPLLLLVAASPAAAAAAEGPGLPSVVRFNRDIRPILSDVCFTCHGPDAKKRKADLRLDTTEGAAVDLGKEGRRAFVAGHLDQSVAWQRLHAEDARKQMPPASAARQLSGG